MAAGLVAIGAVIGFLYGFMCGHRAAADERELMKRIEVLLSSMQAGD
jgi:hypothetical protein